MDPAWERAALALQLLAIDPYSLGGAHVRLRAGPQRDAILCAVRTLGITAKLPITVSDDRLFGGIDLAATLASGRLMRSKAFFDPPRPVILPMAERIEPGLAARLSGLLDKGDTCSLICLDEGDENESLPERLSDRLAFRIAPEGRVPEGWQVEPPSGTTGAASLTDTQIETLVNTAANLGISSLRAVLLAVAAAKAHARLYRRLQATDADLSAAAALVLAHRATTLPEVEDDTPPDTPAEPSDAAEGQDAYNITIPTEMLIEAVRAVLPQGLLIPQAQKSRQASGSGAGQKRRTKRRGRPLPSRSGAPDGQSRIDIVATLRAAAPWQTLRLGGQTDKLVIHPSDIRLKRYEERADRLLIFTVDASGSAAVARLGEAKGAVELLLGDAYASRDHVALVTFRGEGADLLLPPTRSLVQTKRRLAALPGGGGTPLAAGLEEAGRLAHHARDRGMTPTVILLTDGRANIALDGRTDRGQASDDAKRLAQSLHRGGTQTLTIDTGKRPSDALQSLSHSLGGAYVAMPRADAQGLQSTVTQLLDA